MRSALLLAATSLLALSALGCGEIAAPSTVGSGCNTSPFTCPAGSVCWLRDETPSFACLPSGTGKEGEHCFDQIGYATCADGLTCLQFDSSGGICRKYCSPTDPAHGCPSGQKCVHGSVNSSDAGTSASDAGARDGGASGVAGFNVCVPTK